MPDNKEPESEGQMIYRVTDRDFARYEFIDRYGEECSLQESSLATESAIWLGQNRGTHHMGKCMARMHLTVPLVEQLIPKLQHFVETGRLPEPETNA